MQRQRASQMHPRDDEQVHGPLCCKPTSLKDLSRQSLADVNPWPALGRFQNHEQDQEHNETLVPGGQPMCKRDLAGNQWAVQVGRLAHLQLIDAAMLAQWSCTVLIPLEQEEQVPVAQHLVPAEEHLMPAEVYVMPAEEHLVAAEDVLVVVEHLVRKAKHLQM
jgi:hypothetical protein